MKLRNKITGEVFEADKFTSNYVTVVRLNEKGERVTEVYRPGVIEPVFMYDRDVFIRETARACLAGLMANPNCPVSSGAEMMAGLALSAARHLADQIDGVSVKEKEAARK